MRSLLIRRASFWTINCSSTWSSFDDGGIGHSNHRAIKYGGLGFE